MSVSVCYSPPSVCQVVFSRTDRELSPARRFNVRLLGPSPLSQAGFFTARGCGPSLLARGVRSVLRGPPGMSTVHNRDPAQEATGSYWARKIRPRFTEQERTDASIEPADGRLSRRTQHYPKFRDQRRFRRSALRRRPRSLAEYDLRGDPKVDASQDVAKGWWPEARAGVTGIRVYADNLPRVHVR